MKEQVAGILEKVREQSPLIHAITNHVTVNDCANILLAFGASPAMCEAESEAHDFARIAAALYINLGTLTKEQEDAMTQAVQGAAKAGRPVVIDPVGCGAIPRRVAVVERIIRAGRVDIIKGNTGEIKTLAGRSANVKGVDSMEDEADVEEAAAFLAKKYNCTVAATGKVDIITDGTRVLRIDNGVELLKKVTGAGCMAGALCAATAAVCDDMCLAAATAIASICIAGELAYERAQLPGSFRTALMDGIYQLDGNIIKERGRIIC